MITSKRPVQFSQQIKHFLKVQNLQVQREHNFFATNNCLVVKKLCGFNTIIVQVVKKFEPEPQENRTLIRSLESLEV